MAAKKNKNTSTNSKPANEKIHSLSPHTEDGADQFLTTNHGAKINDDQNS